MTILRLNGSTSGYTELSAPAAAGNNTLVLPTGNGTAGQVLTTDGLGALSWSNTGQLVFAGDTATTSGTSVPFTSIPATAKRITVIFNQVSTSGVAAPFVLQLGTSGGVVTTGYNSTAIVSGGTPAVSTVGLLINDTISNTLSYSGMYTIANVTGNTWVGMGSVVQCSGSTTVQGGPATGRIALAGALTQLRIISSTTASPSATFDAGSINVIYEG